MSDPIERLSSFRSEIEGGPMLPATEVRRRGDKIRHRKNALATAAAVAVVAAIAAPVLVLSGNDVGGGRDIQPAPAPTTDSGAALTRANLMTDADTVHDDQSDWREGTTTSGDGQSAYSVCTQSSMADLGAVTVFQRDWGLEPDLVQGLHQIVAEFPSGAEAEAAYQEIAGWYDDCTPPHSTGYESTAWEPVSIPVAGEAQRARQDYQLDESQAGGESYTDREMWTGLAVSGDRVTVLTHQMPAADYGFPVYPVELMLPAAATRLIGTDPSDDGSDDADALPEEDFLVEASALPSIPDMDPWERVAKQSTPTLACQGAWLSSLEADTTVTGEYRTQYTRGDGTIDGAKVNVAILQYADKAAAGTAYQTVLGWLKDCPATNAELNGEPYIDVAAAPVDIPTSPDVTSVDQAHQVRVTYGAPEACGGADCDAAWFDHQTVAQVGSRLVLVTHAEQAGPCPPGDTSACEGDEDGLKPWLDRVAQTVERVVGRAIWDLH